MFGIHPLWLALIIVGVIVAPLPMAVLYYTYLTYSARFESPGLPLYCPECTSDDLAVGESSVRCNECGHTADYLSFLPDDV